MTKSMTRQQRRISNGALAGAGIMFIVDFFTQWHEHHLNNEGFTWVNYDGWRALRQTGKGLLIGAGAGILYDFLSEDDLHRPFNREEFLTKILDEETIKANPIIHQKLLNEQRRMILELRHLFGSYLVDEPTSVGSMRNGTAIIGSDSDIILPFKRNSFYNLSEMYDYAYDHLYAKYQYRGEVRKNSRTISITFVIGGHTVHFDIIPGREVDNYHQNKKLSLHTRPSYWFGDSSWRKTNVTTQIEFENIPENIKDVTALLKIYNRENDLRIPSVVIQTCMQNGVEDGSIKSRSSLAKNFQSAIDHIHDCLSSGCVLDRANDNNNLLSKMTSQELDRAIVVLETDSESMAENPRVIYEMFTRYSY